MELGLEGKVCVVTGASRGIGLEVTRRLCAEGAHVLLVARDAESLAEAAGGCGETAEWLACDVTEPDAPQRIVATCAEQMGGIDVLVNNAGIADSRGIDDLEDADYEAHWRVSVLGPMRLRREAAPRMASRGAGRIVNVASTAAKRPSGNTAYSVGKAGMLSLSRAFADRWAPEGVLVNAVAPGPATSEMWMGPGGLGEQAAGPGRAEEAVAERAARIPLRRFAEPGEIADVIVFLCSARASNVAGAAWSVDGGSVQTIV